MTAATRGSTAGIGPPFVGRDREMSLLRAALDGASSGHGSLLLLTGEAGIGKTRLAEELRAIADRSGFDALRGQCHEIRGAPPYWPWPVVLRACMDARSVTDPRELAGSSAGALVDLLPELKGRLRARSPHSSVDPESARFALFTAVVTLLARAARRRPVLIVLEDIHWADDSALRLLAFLARELHGHRILVLATCREDEPGGARRILDALADVASRTLQVRGLQPLDIDTILSALMGGEVPAGMAAAVSELTEGNPFFVGEIARVAGDDRSASRERDSRSVIHIPPTVTAVLRRRLDRLSAGSRRILRVAAAIGRDFDAGILADVCASPADVARALRDGLDTLLLRESVAPRYEFSHALIGRALYDEIANRDLPALHARIAGAYESASGEASAIAFHLARSGQHADPARLLRYSRVAGEQALTSQAFVEATTFFEQALSLVNRSELDEESVALLAGLGRARAASSLRWNRQESWEQLRRVAEFHLARGNIEEAVAAATDPFITPESATDVARTVERVLAAVAAASLDAGLLLVRLAGAIYFETGDVERADEALDRALALARSNGDARLELRALSTAAAVDHFHARWPRALVRSRRVMRLARRARAPHAETYASYRAAFVLTYSGRRMEARDEVRRNVERAERLGDRGLLEDALYVSTALAQLEGDWSKAEEDGRRGLDLSPRHMALLHLRVLRESEVGNTQAAHMYMDRLADASVEAGPYPLRDALCLLARSQIRETERLPANRIGHARVSPVPMAGVLVSVARALEACRSYDAPRAWSERSRLSRFAGTIIAPLVSTDRLLGRLAAVVGDHEAAMRHFEDALGFCRSASYRPELAWTCHDAADLLLESHGDTAVAVTLIEEAISIASALGMRPLLERLGSLQRRVRSRDPELTPRERSVLELVSAGKTNKSIARQLSISPNTVAVHVARILAKTGTRNRTEAAHYALRQSIIDPTA